MAQNKETTSFSWLLIPTTGAVVGIAVFTLCLFVFDLGVFTSTAIAILAVVVVLSMMINVMEREKKAMIVMADVLKRQNLKQAEALSTSAVRELRGTVKSSTPVILNHFVKSRVEKRLEELGLLKDANVDESFSVVYSEEIEAAERENVTTAHNQGQDQGGFTLEKDEQKNIELEEGNKKEECKLRDGMGLCVEEENLKEIADSRGVQEHEPPKDEKPPEKIFTQIEINPATGLPILENGLDALGNPRGFDLEREERRRLDDEQRLWAGSNFNSW